MKPIIIANWKMNLDLNQAESIISKLPNVGKSDLLIAPPIPYLHFLVSKYSKINFGAQDISSFSEYGSYSGEYSATMLKNIGGKFSLIGHSERRTHFNENNEIVRQKATNCSKVGIMPIICVGETLSIREQNTHIEFILKQIRESIPLNISSNLMLAYEPCWAIGTGRAPSIDQLKEVFSEIKTLNMKLQLENNIKLLYGGSVSLDNYEKILSIENIDGLLIGGASLKSEIFYEIIRNCLGK